MRIRSFQLDWMFKIGVFLWLLIRSAKGQFYETNPAFNITSNAFSLNSSAITLGALLILASQLPVIPVYRSIFSVICIECQLQIINENPNLLPDMKMEVEYYSVAYGNTSQASVAALEYSLNSTHIATFGPDAVEPFLPIVTYLESINVAAYSPQILSTTFLSTSNFPTLRTISVSDFYLTNNYLQLMRFFGWNWIGAGFADDDIGQSGRYAFGQQKLGTVFFPCFYIYGGRITAGLTELASCLRNNTDVKVLLLWGDSPSVLNALNYFYDQGDMDYLSFVVNPIAAREMPYEFLRAPPSFLKGMLFLDENYDEVAGFESCMAKFLASELDMPPEANAFYEETFHCQLNPESDLPDCEGDSKGRTAPCKCAKNDVERLIRPYTQTPVLYRDILQAYALGLHRIKYDCGSLKGDYCSLTEITGRQLLEAVSQTAFVGFSGLISYNQSTTSRVNGTLNVYQASGEIMGVNHPNPIFVAIGFMTPYALESFNGIYLDQSLFHFKTGGDTVPISIAVPETTDLSDGFWPVFIFSLCIVGLVLVAGALVFVVVEWKSAPVRRAGRPFLLLMLTGIACLLTANLLWSVQASILICVIKGILSYLAIGLCCGALFAKAVEFYLIFSNSSNRSYEQAAGARTGTFFLVFGLVMAHTALWYFLYMFVGGPVLCQSFQSSADFYYWYVGCLPSNTTDDNLYIILTIALTSAFNLFAVILLAIAWDIVSVYNLAQCIIFVECNLLVLAVTILAIYYSFPEYPNYSMQQYLMRSISTTFAAYFTLALIFIPLIYTFYVTDDDEDDEALHAHSGTTADPLSHLAASD